MQSRTKDSGIAQTRDGAEIAWWAHGDGPALLLIAGQGCTHDAWRFVIPELAEHHRVLVYDQRGTGESTFGPTNHSGGAFGGDIPAADESGIAIGAGNAAAPGAGPAGTHVTWSTRRFAQDAITVLDDARAPSASVYGHSMGGRIAQWCAIDHSDRLERLVLASTTGGDARGVRRDRAVTRTLFSGDASAMAPLFFHEEFRTSHGEVVDDFFGGDVTAAARRAQFTASRNHDAWDLLNRICVPTLIVHGGADQVTLPANARLLADRIPSAELLVEPEALHCPHLDTGTVRQRTRRFLTEARI